MKKSKENTMLVWDDFNRILDDSRSWGFIITPQNDEDFPDLLLPVDGDKTKIVSFPYNEPYDVTNEELETTWRVLFPWEVRVLKYANSLADFFGKDMDDETVKAFMKAFISCALSVIEEAALNWDVNTQEYPKGKEEFTKFIEDYMKMFSVEL